MERIIVCGNENDIVSELSKYVNSDGARIFVHNLQMFSNVLDEDERVEIKREKRKQKTGMGFVVPKTNYYINLKMTTIAFIGLLLDISFTEGFTSFALEIFGVTAGVIRKLSDKEKCVLFHIKAGNVWAEDGKYSLRESVPCINYIRKCEWQQYDRCGISEEEIGGIIQELLKKNIIKQKGNLLIYRF